MADREGPWGREGDVAPPPPKPPASERGRLLAWLGLLAVIGAGVVLLFRAFPGTVTTPEDKAWLARSVGILVLVSAGLLVPGRTNLRQMLRHGAIWAGIIFVLVLGATYSEELMGVAGRVKAKFSGAYPVATAAGRELVVTQDAGGGFYVMGRVNGGLVRFLVDTGASDTVLTPDDARRVGIETAGLRFNQSAETANGTGYGAAYTADSVEVGSIRFTGVPVMINQAPMSNSLLGMSFLKRLESFQVKGDRLYLKARE